jgi:hypothetical protein
MINLLKLNRRTSSINLCIHVKKFRNITINTWQLIIWIFFANIIIDLHIYYYKTIIFELD